MELSDKQLYVLRMVSVVEPERLDGRTLRSLKTRGLISVAAKGKVKRLKKGDQLLDKLAQTS